MQRQLPNGSIYGNSLKRLIRDLQPFKQVDFITNDNEIQGLQKYSKFRGAYEAYRANGGHPSEFGVIVGFSESQEQFFLLPKSFCDTLSELLQKKLSELTSEERMLFVDDSNESTIDVLQEGVLV